MPDVSVITPFLDQELFLAEAVESVVAQTFHDWELLLIDDGSSDRSPAIAAGYAARDPERIRLFRHSDGGNHGAAAARNLGIANARAEFVALLDADDLYEPEKLATEVALLRAAPEAAMLYAPTRWWWDDGSKRKDWVERLRLASGRLHPPPTLVSNVLLRKKGAIPCTCGVMMRRAAILAVGGFEERFRLYEDQTLWAKLFLRYPVIVSSRCLARYRQHVRSTSAAANRSGEYDRWKAHSAEFEFLKWLRSYVAETGSSDRKLDAALSWAFAPYRSGARPDRIVRRRQFIRRIANKFALRN